MPFFLLRGADPGPGMGSVCRRPSRLLGVKPQLERVCGLSRGHGCCILLLYNRLRRSNFDSYLWS
jgi:hypothetical protein